jgi:hypothetical protein
MILLQAHAACEAGEYRSAGTAGKRGGKQARIRTITTRLESNVKVAMQQLVAHRSVRGARGALRRHRVESRESTRRWLQVQPRSTRENGTAARECFELSDELQGERPESYGHATSPQAVMESCPFSDRGHGSRGLVSPALSRFRSISIPRGSFANRRYCSRTWFLGAQRVAHVLLERGLAARIGSSQPRTAEVRTDQRA